MKLLLQTSLATTKSCSFCENFKNKLEKTPELYEIGCLGKIVSFKESEDKRFLIELKGVARFKIINEIKNIFLHGGPFNQSNEEFGKQVHDTILKYIPPKNSNIIISAHNSVIESVPFAKIENQTKKLAIAHT